MKILDRINYSTTVKPGDSVHIMKGGEELLVKYIDTYMSISGVIIFEFEPGDIPGIEYGIGGAFIQED